MSGFSLMDYVQKKDYESLTSTIVALIVSIAVFGVIIFFIPNNMIKQMQKYSLKMDGNIIEKSNGYSLEKFTLEAGTKLIKTTDNSDNIIQLELINGKRRMPVFGYEDMNDIFLKMTSYVRLEDIIEKKRTLSFSDMTGILAGVLIYAIVIVIIPMIFTYLKLEINEYAVKTVDSIIPFMTGVFTIFFRPISKIIKNNKIKTFEIIGGIALILYAVLKIFS
jgi:hypothetical protein